MAFATATSLVRRMFVLASPGDRPCNEGNTRCYPEQALYQLRQISYPIGTRRGRLETFDEVRIAERLLGVGPGAWAGPWPADGQRRPRPGRPVDAGQVGSGRPCRAASRAVRPGVRAR